MLITPAYIREEAPKLNKLLILLLLFLPACLPWEDSSFEIINLSSPQVELFTEAQQWWNKRLPGANLSIADKSFNQVSMKLLKDKQGWFGCEKIGFHCYLYVDSSQPYSPAQFCIIVRHELGHFLGYGHNKIKNHVMNPKSPPCKD